MARYPKPRAAEHGPHRGTPSKPRDTHQRDSLAGTRKARDARLRTRGLIVDKRQYRLDRAQQQNENPSNKRRVSS